MIIKSADDKSKRVRLFEELLCSDMLDEHQKKLLLGDLYALKQGIQGEKDAAYYLDADYRDSKNCAVLHDLRLEVDGEVAQIDHLIINRALIFFLLETKNFGGNLSINELGEFTVSYPSEKTIGIPSPLEQSRRHERILEKVLKNLGITGRANTKPTFQHLVLVHPRATITRPSEKKFDTSTVIKADQFAAWHEKWQIGLSTVLTGLMNIRSTETVKEWGEALREVHKPIDLLELPAFLKINPKTANRYEAKMLDSIAVSESRKPWKSQPKTTPQKESNKKSLKCSTCGETITYAEGQFCWKNEKRFGGLQYCREHQRAFR